MAKSRTAQPQPARSEALTLPGSYAWAARVLGQGQAGCPCDALAPCMGTCVLRDCSYLLWLSPSPSLRLAITSLECSCVIHQHDRRKQSDEIKGKKLVFAKTSYAELFTLSRGYTHTRSHATLTARNALSVEWFFFSLPSLM